uniref:Uncharacterized protein n=1 Tax=Fagus sylvatica TaxID=28930 RepID=A0A2N9EQ29_FAGSY
MRERERDGGGVRGAGGGVGREVVAAAGLAALDGGWRCNMVVGMVAGGSLRSGVRKSKKVRKERERL